MPSVTLTRLKARIGDLGLPGVVWVVRSALDHDFAIGFYDRDRADTYASADPFLFVDTPPLQIKDAIR